MDEIAKSIGYLVIFMAVVCIWGMSLEEAEKEKMEKNWEDAEVWNLTYRIALRHIYYVELKGDSQKTQMIKQIRLGRLNVYEHDIKLSEKEFMEKYSHVMQKAQEMIQQQGGYPVSWRNDSIFVIW